MRKDPSRNEFEIAVYTSVVSFAISGPTSPHTTHHHSSQTIFLRVTDNRAGSHPQQQDSSRCSRRAYPAFCGWGPLARLPATCYCRPIYRDVSCCTASNLSSLKLPNFTAARKKLQHSRKYDRIGWYVLHILCCGTERRAGTPRRVANAQGDAVTQGLTAEPRNRGRRKRCESRIIHPPIDAADSTVDFFCFFVFLGRLQVIFSEKKKKFSSTRPGMRYWVLEYSSFSRYDSSIRFAAG